MRYLTKGALRRRSSKIMVALVAALAIGVPVAWASDVFADVPSTNPFHDNISAIKGAGVTQGCGGGNYCPEDNVTRQAMAAFMHRGFGRIAISRTELVGTVPYGATTYTDVARVQVNVGGTGSATQYVKVDANLNVYQAHECQCRFHLRIRDDTTGQVAVGGLYQTIETNQDHSFTALGVFDATPGPHTYTLQMRYVSYTTPPPSGGTHSLAVFNPYLVATTFPFLEGSTSVNNAGAMPSKG